MLKLLLFGGIVSLVSGVAFAQQSNQMSYPQQMQQDLNRAYQSATAEFNKNYPRPHIDTPAGGKTTDAMQQAVTPPPPPPQPVVVSPPVAPPVEQQSVSKIPDVAVNSSGAGQSTSVGNIYAPGGNGHENSSGGTINPYR